MWLVSGWSKEQFPRFMLWARATFSHQHGALNHGTRFFFRGGEARTAVPRQRPHAVASRPEASLHRGREKERKREEGEARRTTERRTRCTKQQQAGQQGTADRAGGKTPAGRKQATADKKGRAGKAERAPTAAQTVQEAACHKEGHEERARRLRAVPLLREQLSQRCHKSRWFVQPYCPKSIRDSWLCLFAESFGKRRRDTLLQEKRVTKREVKFMPVFAEEDARRSPAPLEKRERIDERSEWGDAWL
jgi:hypothetical protein